MAYPCVCGSQHTYADEVATCQRQRRDPVVPARPDLAREVTSNAQLA